MSANSKNKEEAYNGIKELVEKFKSNYKQFHSSDYNETLTRQDFINPFFEYLGWDISNKEGLSQTYRDVIHEDKLKIGKETKAPDYSFRIGGNRVFFVEAKKPSRNLKEDSDAAYQIRRYAWSGKLAVSILTDFEEFAIYDCSKKPSPNDKASMSRIEYINYEDYLNRFDFLYDTFAKENVLRGSLEKYNADTKSKKGTESVDIDFLNSLDDLRTKLASNISKLNSLSLRDLNFAVQHIIDRIIFLRVAEDRGVENYGDLREACFGNNYYKNIVEIFKKADGKYNSGIFDFSKDKITQNIEVDNKVIKEIINDLYYPKSPYEFSVISVEIIGNAYEQFLGKTITIGKNSKAKIELKPEVRKAGGVYYTPEYIVDYIVENTVGEKIKGKTPKEIANIKIVDPACGSGSFLIGAYKYLLNYHREYYSKQGKKKFLGSKEDAITEDGELALWVKKQILINNIFGVDIDSNAVEVTKLSLLLKCMENETPASIMNNQSLFNERALPSLDENIKCGNSLIGNDFYSGGDSLNIDIETQYKINCFDWEREFSSIFKSGGFDIVIGNPPYVKEYTDREIFENIKKSKLVKYYQGKMDLWYFFVCFGLDILKDNGKLGFIAPNNWITNSGASILRNKILTDTKILKYVDFGDFKVFADAGIQTMVFILNKENISEDYQLDYYKVLNKNISILDLSNFLFKDIKNEDISIIKTIMSKNKMLNDIITFVDANKEAILYKIKEKGNYYLNDKEVIQGIVPNPDFAEGKSVFVLRDDEINKFTKEEKKYLRKYYISFYRYFIEETKNYILYITKKNCHSLKNLDNIKEHLSPFKKIMSNRRETKQGKIEWYQLHWARNEEFFKGEKIASLRKCVDRPRFIYTEEDFYCGLSINIIKPANIDLKYLTGILNSKLIAFWLKNKGKMQGSNYQVDKEPLLNIPIVNTKDEKVKSKLVKLVDNIIAINKKLVGENNPNTKEILERQVRALDGEIDRLVYGLYGLSDNEIRIIENMD